MLSAISLCRSSFILPRSMPRIASVSGTENFNESSTQSQPVLSDAPSQRRKDGRHRRRNGLYSSFSASSQFSSALHQGRVSASWVALLLIASTVGNCLYRLVASAGQGPHKDQRQGGTREIPWPEVGGRIHFMGYLDFVMSCVQRKANITMHPT